MRKTCEVKLRLLSVMNGRFLNSKGRFRRGREHEITMDELLRSAELKDTAENRKRVYQVITYWKKFCLKHGYYFGGYGFKPTFYFIAKTEGELLTLANARASNNRARIAGEIEMFIESGHAPNEKQLQEIVPNLEKAERITIDRLRLKMVKGA